MARFNLHPRSARQLTVACAVCAVVLAFVPAAAALHRGGNWHLWLRTPPYWPVAVGTQGPPPPITPAILQAFQALISSYEAVGMNIPVSFSEWIVMNGITDARDQWCLMWLWWQWTHQGEVG